MITKDFIKKFSSKGIITVEFIKKDHTHRIMNCTTDYLMLEQNNKYNFTPPKSKTSIEPEGILKVWDINKQAFRSITIANIKKIVDDQDNLIYFEAYI